MINFENTEVFGWEAAIRGMRNPMNSWEKSDSGKIYWNGTWYTLDPVIRSYFTYYGMNLLIGPNDLDLMRRLAKGGPVHAKYRRMITVYVDITAPLYWWKEFDTYKVGTVANSCSTMHKITDKEFTLEDFSYEYLKDFDGPTRKDDNGLSRFPWFKISLESTINVLNYARELYLETSDELKKLEKSYIIAALDAEEKALKIRELQKKKKQYWWQMIQLLPSSYNQKRTVMLNYEVLAHIYKDRKYHKLDEWREHKKSTCSVDRNRHCENPKEFLLSEDCAVGKGFCDWIKTLPYPELICGEYANKEETTPNCFVPIPGDK